MRVKQATAKMYFEGLAKFGMKLDDSLAEQCLKLKLNEKRGLVGLRKFRGKAKVVGMLKESTGSKTKTPTGSAHPSVSNYEFQKSSRTSAAPSRSQILRV